VGYRIAHQRKQQEVNDFFIMLPVVAVELMPRVLNRGLITQVTWIPVL